MEYYATPEYSTAPPPDSAPPTRDHDESDGSASPSPPARRTWLSWLFGRREASTLESEDDGDDDDEEADEEAGGQDQLRRVYPMPPNCNRGLPPAHATGRRGDIAASPGVGESLSGSRRSAGSGSDGNSASASASASEASDTAPSPQAGGESLSPRTYHSSDHHVHAPHRHPRERPIAPRRSPHLNAREAEERLAMIRRRIARQCGERNGPQSDDDDDGEEEYDEGSHGSQDEGSGEGSEEDDCEESDEPGYDPSTVDGGRRGSSRALPGQHHHQQHHHSSPGTPRGYNHHPNDGTSSHAASTHDDTDGGSTFIRRDVTTDAGQSEEHTDRSGGASSDTPTRRMSADLTPERLASPPHRRGPPRGANVYSSECSGSDALPQHLDGLERDDLYSDDGGSGSSDGHGRRRASRRDKGYDGPERTPIRAARLPSRSSRESNRSSGGYSIRSEDSIDGRVGRLQTRGARDTVDTRSSDDGPDDDEEEEGADGTPGRWGGGGGAVLSRLWGRSPKPNDQVEERSQPGLVTRLWARGTAVAAAASSAAVAPVPPLAATSQAAVGVAHVVTAPTPVLEADPDEAAAAILAGWSEEQVCEWLTASDPNFAAYLPSFRENHIDGRALTQLTREDLADLGVRSVGHRLSILRARADLGVASSHQNKGKQQQH